MNRTIISICIVVAMLFACKAKTTESIVSEGSKTTDLIVNPEVLIQMDIKVEGMTCTGCENTINSGVSEIAGVVEVKSSFQEGKTFVKFDSTQTSIDKITLAIGEKGYNVKSFALHDTEKENSTATE